MAYSEEMLIEVCNHCGDDVSKGSGKYINRVIDSNDITARLYNNREFPLGDFVCDYCDTHSLTDNEE
jgi:hypothetical protein